VRGQRIPQRGGLDGVGEGHPGRRQPVAARGRALARPQDRRDHLIGGANRCCVVIGLDVEIVLVDGCAITVLALDQYHSNRIRRYRHAEYGVQGSSIAVCWSDGMKRDEDVLSAKTNDRVPTRILEKQTLRRYGTGSPWRRSQS
jgi:hypothetical protein